MPASTSCCAPFSNWRMTDVSKTVGVLGGMGPDATVDFMAKVIALTPAGRDQDHVHMIVDNNPAVPNRQAAILGKGEDPSAAIAAMGTRLEAAGADFLVIVCNSAHAFVGRLREVTTIPLVSIIDVTADACARCDAVGILATDGCIASRLYQDALQARNVRPVVPGDEALEDLMQLIARIKAGDQGQQVGGAMQAIAAGLVEQGARAVIAGCTEIPLVLRDGMVAAPIVASTDVLAMTTVAIARGERDLPGACADRVTVSR